MTYSESELEEMRIRMEELEEVFPNLKDQMVEILIDNPHYDLVTVIEILWNDYQDDYDIYANELEELDEVSNDLQSISTLAGIYTGEV